MAVKQKKWKWNEHSEWKEEAERPAEVERIRSGICKICGSGSFRLSIAGGKMDRTCKGCSDVVRDI